MTQPTIGSNVEEVVYKNVHMNMWDLGGQDSLRNSWATYYVDTSACILVVDSTDKLRMSVVREELFRMLEHESLNSSCVLVYANKQDLRGALGEEDIAELLGLHSITNHPWHIQPCCALTGAGLGDGLDWLTAQLGSWSK